MREEWALVGAILLSCGLLLVVLPVETLLTNIEQSRLVYAVGLVLCAMAVIAHRRTPSGVRPVALATEQTPETADNTVAFDEQLEQITERQQYHEKREQLYEQLDTLAVQILCHVESVDETTARDLLEAGAWTDDPTAQALFVERTDRSLNQRLNEWLFPRRAFRNRVEAVTAELEGLVQRGERRE